MAGITRVNGHADLAKFIGREIKQISAARTNITTAQLDSMVSAISTRCTVTGISAASAFVSGTTDEVFVIVEGMSFTANDDYYLADGTTGATWVELLDELAGASWTITENASF
jgi:hypothetical protein